MGFVLPTTQTERLTFLLDMAWAVFFERIVSGRIKVNKEASMQLHYAAALRGLGDLLCILPGETFSIELESKLGRRNVDIICSLGYVNHVKSHIIRKLYPNMEVISSFGLASAAIELKCFREESNRAVDIDMYDVLKDIERLLSYKDFEVRRFICLTDNSYYVNGIHRGHAATVTIKNNTHYPKGTEIRPSWVGKRKESSRDKSIRFDVDLSLHWTEKNGWYALQVYL